MTKHLIPIRPETAAQMLPGTLQNDGAIDIYALADVATKAFAGCEKSLREAGQIAQGNAIKRWWNNQELQLHMIDSIGFLRDISQVNLGLSAICNDLAEANLEHARRIDSHTQATNNQLAAVQASTTQILDHLLKPKPPALLDSVIPALTGVSLKDPGAVDAWIKTLTASINQEYAVSRERVDAFEVLTQKSLGILEDYVSTLRSNTDATQAAFTTHFSRLDQELNAVRSAAQKLELQQSATLKRSHDQLGDALKSLNVRMVAHHASFETALKAEVDQREVLNLSLLKQLSDQDASVRAKIADLNRHWMKRLVIVAIGLGFVQVGVFVFFAFKTQVL